MKRPLHHYGANVLRYSINFLLAALIFIPSYGQHQNPASADKTQPEIAIAPISWKVSPFRQEVFIENKGQFDGMNDLTANDVKFGVDNVFKVYFTPSGLTWRFEHLVPMTEEELAKFDAMYPGKRQREIANEGEEWEKKHPMVSNRPVFFQMEWIGANQNPEIIAEETVQEYFNYTDPDDPNVSYSYIPGYKKITYKELYPGIDVVYIYKNENGKEGIKYSLIVHPGADPSQVKMKYSGCEILMDADGSIRLHNDKVEDVVELAPETFYENGNVSIPSSFQVNQNVVSFNIGSYNNAETIVVDPWNQVPTSLTTDLKAFDIERDAAGNAYVGGGIANTKLAKYDPAGTLLWTFTTAYPPTGTFGDLSTDPTGNTFFIDAFETT
ncbi:MAG TPA: hypothetical protein VI731_12375, partial [Bacteroidia bacterium]|nr:hypothetical protein [Bacteroidia bacterium]